MPLVFECRLIIVFAVRIIIYLRLSWWLCFFGQLGEVLLLDNFSSVWGKRGSNLFLCSGLRKKGEKYPFLMALCLITPRSGRGSSHCTGRRVDWLRSCVMRPLLAQPCGLCSPWLLRKHPLWVSRGQGRFRNLMGDLAEKISIFSVFCWALLLQCAYFVLLSNYFLYWNSTLCSQSDSTWISLRDSHILVKQVGAGNIPPNL